MTWEDRIKDQHVPLGFISTTEVSTVYGQFIESRSDWTIPCPLMYQYSNPNRKIHPDSQARGPRRPGPETSSLSTFLVLIHMEIVFLDSKIAFSLWCCRLSYAVILRSIYCVIPVESCSALRHTHDSRVDCYLVSSPSISKRLTHRFWILKSDVISWLHPQKPQIGRRIIYSIWNTAGSITVVLYNTLCCMYNGSWSSVLVYMRHIKCRIQHTYIP